MSKFELSDVLKGDLTRLWKNHAPEVDHLNSSPSTTTNAGGVKVGNATIENDVYDFMMRMVSFLLTTASTTDRNEHKYYNRTRSSLKKCLLGGFAVPRLITQRECIALEFPSFREEFERHEHEWQRRQQPQTPPSSETNCLIRGGGGGEKRQSSSFLLESYLHNRPEHALAAIGCAVGLMMTHRYREYCQYVNHRATNNPSPFLSTLQQQELQQATTNARFVIRLYNFSLGGGGKGLNGREGITHNDDDDDEKGTKDGSRSNQTNVTTPLMDIKTNLVNRLVCVVGQATKVYPKRLRVMTADFECVKCGGSVPHVFFDGKYNVPTRCTATTSMARPQPQQKKCRSQKFELRRETATYADCQDLRIQEIPEEYAPTNSSAGGRSPKSLDLQVDGSDMVDRCRAGDVVRVVGVVKAINTAIKAGRRGKGALETSTYQLYLKANTITVLGRHAHAQEAHGQGDNENDDDNDDNDKYDLGADDGFHAPGTTIGYSQEQLTNVNALAHADPMRGPMPVRAAFPFDLLVRSICPAIIGHDLVKAGILLALLGGTPQSATQQTQAAGAGPLSSQRNPNPIRANCHVLIVGDPGMGKSQMLLAANQILPRSVYVGGNTTSSVGLTVTLTREKGEVGIEAGAFVLADRGVCCIDEFDKMSKTNQDGCLEAMEQQQISIAKAGVVASLPARCSVIAAANPINGHYSRSKTVQENININGPLLSRFDLIFVLRDRKDYVSDGRITNNIMALYKQQERQRQQHRGNGSITLDGHETPTQDTLDIENETGWVPIDRRLEWVSTFQKSCLPATLLKDYISYARQYCFPKLTKEAGEELKSYYLEMRSRRGEPDAVPITTRTLEALIRLSQARAKACLRDHVLHEDAKDVVYLVRQSSLQTLSNNHDGTEESLGTHGRRRRRKNKRRQQEDDFILQLKKMRSGGDRPCFSLDQLKRTAKSLGVPSEEHMEFIDQLRNEDPPRILKYGVEYKLN